MNRLRIRFKRGEEIKYISHLDLIRVWQRAFRRAGIMLAYSEGFNPHPRMALAAPLALGVTGESELMDVYTVKPVSAHAFSVMLGPQLPCGLEILQAYPIPLESPTLQAQLVSAEYEVKVNAPELEPLKQAIDSLLLKDSIPWEHQRDTGTRSYDLRKLIESVTLANYDQGIAILRMKLRCGSDGAGRPEQVSKALGLDTPLAISRTRLLLRAA